MKNLNIKELVDLSNNKFKPIELREEAKAELDLRHAALEQAQAAEKEILEFWQDLGNEK